MDSSSQALPVSPSYQVERRAIPQTTKAWFVTKLVLMAASIVFSIIAIGLSAGLSQSADTSDEFSGGLSSIVIFWVVPPTCVAVLWSVAELITILARPGRRGIHPGAHVGVQLVLWLCLALSLWLSSSFLSLVGSGCDRDLNRGRECDVANGHVPIVRAIVAFGILLTLVHFVQFVLACIETAKRNAAPRVVVMQPSQPNEMLKLKPGSAAEPAVYG